MESRTQAVMRLIGTLVLLVLLALLSVDAPAQPRMLRVRLFWQHPPTNIHVVPEKAVVRYCVSCAPRPLDGGLDITALGSKLILVNGRVRIEGDTFPPFRVDGELRIQSRDGRLLITLEMGLEEYVTAVLQGESAGFKSDEALKAMAVAARTYAVHFGSRHQSESFDFCDTTHCQDLRLGNESPRARAAAKATEGELLWFEGRPAATYYMSSCGGEIDDASALEPNLHVKYLRPHHDEYCIRVPDEWQSEISKANLSHAVGRTVRRLEVITRTHSGRVETLRIDNRTIGATAFRFAVGRSLGWDKIRSDLYQLEDHDNSVLFRGRGEGHGVGLCQTGADIMGQQGHSYREILSYYYSGTSVGLSAQGLAWQKLPGESIDIVSTHKEDASLLLVPAERALQFATKQTGWAPKDRPQVRVYPSLGVYRDATGEPGWIAASTVGNVIRLQPVGVLQGKNSLNSTLRHEFLHLLIEAHSSPTAPLWLREGLATYLENQHRVIAAKCDGQKLERRLQTSHNEEEVRRAYRDSAAAVADEVESKGLPAVLAQLQMN